MSEPDPTEKRLRRVGHFVLGILYLAFASMIITAVTGCNYFLVFAAVTMGAVFTGTMILVWATSWAIQTDRREKQFSIRTLLFLMLLAAVYFGAVRWIADLTGDRFGAGRNTFLAAAVMCFVLSAVSLPFLLFLMESLVWFAAWLVRRPWMQRWLGRP